MSYAGGLLGIGPAPTCRYGHGELKKLETPMALTVRPPWPLGQQPAFLAVAVWFCPVCNTLELRHE